MHGRKFDGAITDYDQALALDPNLADAYNNRGIVQFEKGDVEAALADYSKAIALSPAHSLAYFNRGIALRWRGDLEGSQADLDRAVTLNPRLQDSIQRLADRGRKNERQTVEAPSATPP
jgi:tetratricopeptide (TPR) repeat protein